jgi:hypothetical protein
MAITKRPTPRQLASLKSEFTAFRALSKKIVDADVDSDECRRLIDEEFAVKLRIHSLMREISHPPFAIVMDGVLIGLALENEDDDATAFFFWLPADRIIHTE